LSSVFLLTGAKELHFHCINFNETDNPYYNFMTKYNFVTDLNETGCDGENWVIWLRT
jgi:hypothetical protein